MDQCTRTGPALGTGTRSCPPQRDASPRRRSARVLGLASTGVLLSACAHVLATGAALPPAALAGGSVVAVGVMFPLTGRRLSVALGTAALALLQSVLHLLSAALTPSAQSAHSLAVPTEAVTRFSRIAFISVCVLAVTGLYQSRRQVGSLSALVDTRFGQPSSDCASSQPPRPSRPRCRHGPRPRPWLCP